MLGIDTCNRDKQQGFILVTGLFFLFMMALMVLSLLNTVHLELRMSQNLSIASQQFQVAEAGLKIAENRLILLAQRKILDLHQQLNYAGFQLSYDIKRFAMPFCCHEKIAYIYRVIAKARKTTADAVLILETTYAVAENEECQGGEARLIRTGRSAWRELNKY
jgi:Tfp pilus assembly protein PilX